MQSDQQYKIRDLYWRFHVLTIEIRTHCEVHSRLVQMQNALLSNKADERKNHAYTHALETS